MTTRLTQCLVGFATLSLSQVSYAAQDETIWVTIDALAAEHFQQDTVSKRKLKQQFCDAKIGFESS